MQLITVIAVAIGIIALLFGLLVRTNSRLRGLRRMYSELHRVARFDDVIDVISGEIAKRGARVVTFFRINRVNRVLENSEGYISLLEKSSPVKSFFNLRPVRLGAESEVDRSLGKVFKKNIIFVPVQMSGEESCWKENNCGDIRCGCHGKKRCSCWLKSGKRYRGADLESYTEKTLRCISCKSFLPIGVFAMEGRIKGKIHRLLRDNFGDVLRSAVHHERALCSAARDHLTGILNRMSLMKEAQKLFKLAARYGSPLSVCMLDIDHFKRFNDTYGHQTGDDVLRALARLVASSVRETDIVARYGGEEFSIVFPSTDKAAAVSVAEKIRSKVKETALDTRRGPLKVTISLGIAAYPEDERSDLSALIKKADVALYQAKESRNRVAAYNPRTPDIPSKDKKPGDEKAYKPAKRKFEAEKNVRIEGLG